jgi:hypothetical protein
MRGSGLSPPGYPQPQGGNGLLSAEFRGEKHPPLITSRGLKRGNFAGPGTHVLERIKRGDQGVNFTDSVAKGHDLRYMLAKNQGDIRSADFKFIKSLSGSKGNIINKTVARNVMKGKVFLENKGLMSRSQFSGSLPNALDADDKLMLQAELGKMEQKGLGNPANNLVKQMRASIQNGRGTEVVATTLTGSGKAPKKLNRKEMQSFVENILKSWHTLHGTNRDAASVATSIMRQTRGQGVTHIKDTLAGILIEDMEGGERWRTLIRKDINVLWTALRKGQSGAGLTGGSFWSSIKSGLSKIGKTIATGAKAVAKAVKPVANFVWKNKKDIVEGAKVGIELAGML